MVYTYIPLSSAQYLRYEAIVHVDDYETYRATKPSYSLSKKTFWELGGKWTSAGLEPVTFSLVYTLLICKQL